MRLLGSSPVADISHPAAFEQGPVVEIREDRMDPCPNTSSYVASSLVDAFHGIPHVDINLNPRQNNTSHCPTKNYL